MPIDLGKSYESPAAQPEPSEPAEKSYPSLYIDGDEKDLADLPDAGELTVRYKKTSHNVSTRGGKTSVSVALDILSIENVESEEEEAGEDEDPGDALDKAAAAEKAAAEEAEETEK